MKALGFPSPRVRARIKGLRSSPAVWLIVCAAVFHILFTVSLFVIGRTQIAPSLVDRDGIIDAIASDSYGYRHQALGFLSDKESDPLTEPPGNVTYGKVLSIEFALFGRVLGNNILSAEPFNLFCYLVILCLVIMLGREIGSRRVGLLAAGAVALWPTFLLHSTQMLKDPFFIMLGLALILIVTTWLTRIYAWRDSIVMGTGLSITAGLLLLIRLKAAGFIFLVLLVGLGFLIIRQCFEKRLLHRNFICPLLILLTSLSFASYLAATKDQKFKQHAPVTAGLSKLVVPANQLQSESYRRRDPLKVNTSATTGARLFAFVDQVRLGIAAARSDFNLGYPDAGSSIDRDVYFNSFPDLLWYLPRAVQIGLWAPFPYMWTGEAKHVGRAGRLLSGAETLFMYLCEFLGLVALWRNRRGVANWLIAFIYLIGVTALALVVSNVGALFRVRYLLVILLIVLAVKGLESLKSDQQNQPVDDDSSSADVTLAGDVHTSRRKRAMVAFASFVAISAALSGGWILAERSSRALDFTLINRSKIALRGVYLSPSDSAGWQENVLERGILPSGEGLGIRFSPDEQTTAWDLRIESDQGIADWKKMNLPEISQVILRISPDGKIIFAEFQ